MKFKQEYIRREFEGLDSKMKEIGYYMDAVAIAQTKKQLIVTRVKDPVKGEVSKTHEEGRAFDARIEFFGSSGNEWYYTLDEAQKIAKLVNERFPRRDGKLTCLVHKIDSSTTHFHVQKERSHGKTVG